MPGASEQHVEVDNIRGVSDRIGSPIAILIDLAGPRMCLRQVLRWGFRNIAASANRRREFVGRNLAVVVPALGITSWCGAPTCNLQGLIRHAARWACEVGFGKPDGQIVIVGGLQLVAEPRAAEKGLARHGFCATSGTSSSSLSFICIT